MMFHAFLLECEKLLFWAAFDHRFLHFQSSLVSMVIAVLLNNYAGLHLNFFSEVEDFSTVSNLFLV